MRVFIFGMTGPPRGWCVYSCLCVYVSERKICREEAHLWLLFRCIKIIYFKTAPRKVSVVIREALGHLAQKTDALVCANMPWKRQLFSASGYSWDPRQSGKAPQLTGGCWFSPGLPLLWLKPGYRFHAVPEVLVSSGESTSEPRLLLLLKFSLSGNFMFL